MEKITTKFNVGFMKYRFAWSLVSLALVVASAFIWFKAGDSKFGVDFLGGNVLHLKFDAPVEPGKIRSTLEQGGVEGSVVQSFGPQNTEFSIRLPSMSEGGAETGARVRELLSKIEGTKYEVLQEEFVGPIIGDQIKSDAIKAVIFSFIAILLYVSFRFHWSYAVGGVVALIHDSAVMTGATVLSGREFSSSILAAVLTIIGFSINDTIVVFDRIRENLALGLKAGGDKGVKRVQALREMSLIEIMDLSVNETLSRTILTSLTVLFVSFCLWQFGGGSVSDMAFALTIGVIAGTYSSIYVACAIVVLFQKNADRPLKELTLAPKI